MYGFVNTSRYRAHKMLNRLNFGVKLTLKTSGKLFSNIYN